MEPKKEEALRAKENAAKLFAQKDFMGAKKFALNAQTLYPKLEGISQMLATFEVYIASEIKVSREIDLYSILGLEPTAGKAKLKKQYRKMAALLHPDKNKSVGADGAFKLVSEAWTLLSDRNKKGSYDVRRNKQLSSGVLQTNASLACTGGVTVFDNSSKSSVSHTRLDTFWTVCTSCHVQYEYLRKYLNKRLSCKNCRGIFIAMETGAAPVNGSFPYCPWSYVADNGFNGVAYIPTTSIYFGGNGVLGFHSGHGFECVPNASFQRSSLPGASGNTNETRANRKHYMNKAAIDTGSNMYSGYNEPSASKAGSETKRRKVDTGGTSERGNEAVASKAASEVKLVNGNGSIRHNSRISTLSENPTRRCSAAPAFDARKLLIEKARTEILKKLEEIRLTSTAPAVVEDGPVHQSEMKKTGWMTITVPDSDFHDFDRDRAEECFKPKQIWALYDEEDGMPRLYCLIREVISIKPFKIHISYLSSKTESEFESVNCVDYGFTKSCGIFRAWNSEIVDQVNVFSHLLSREKAGRGGCVRIYPKSGDVWVIYRNWSPKWNRTTPKEERQHYEMVEVLHDYSEELGVCVTPLVKLNGFKTVYGRNSNKDVIKWIPRKEILRFSHQVPSCLLRGDSSNMQLPDGCWDLDPAATPDELLQAVTGVKVEEKSQSENEV